MLGATQKQLFEGTPTAEGGFDITGFRPYTPYSSNVNNYFAGFSPMQQRAQQQTANLQVPGQYDQASQMTGMAGLGSLGLAGQMAGAGQQYANQAQDPMAMQGYMSPYMQNVVDYQKSQALRDYQMGQPMMARQAIGQGAFGGNRLALQQAEAQRGLMSQLQGIQSQGTQQAFQNAQQAQQYAANLGLQGRQAGLQGLGQFGQMAGQLGQLGTAQLGAQQNIIAAQNAAGKEQQSLEQSKINQAIQDYSTQQQYPLMQLGFMSNMLRGLPLQATTTQTYQAQPSQLNQGLGVLAGAAGARQAGLFAEGGTIKGLAEGGIAGYANRGLAQVNPRSAAVQGIRAKLEMMPIDQLQQVAQSSSSEEVRTMALEIMKEKEIRAQAEQQAQASIAQDQRPMPTPVSERVGLPAAPAGAMDTLNAASGGIVAFADEGQVELDEEEAAKLQQDFMKRQKYAEFFKKRREDAGIGAPKAGLADYYAKEQTDLAEATKRKGGYDLLNYGLNLATQAGPLMQAAAKAGKETLPGMIAREDELRGRRGNLAKGLAEVAEGERLLALGDIEGADKLFNLAEDRKSRENIASTRASISDKADNHARGYLADARAKNDNRPEEIILLEGRNDYLTKVQQAQLTRADVAGGQLGVNVSKEANDAVATRLSFMQGDARTEFEKRKAQDAKNAKAGNKTNTAGEYKKQLFDEEVAKIRNRTPSGGGGSGKPKAGAADLPPGFQRDKT
jgi:hypothetical protein